MNVACCQIDIAWENKPANFAKVNALLDAAEVPPGSLLVLPEMFATGFSMNVAVTAEGEDRETERFLARTARARGLYVLGGVVTRAPDGRGNNEAVVYGPAGPRSRGTGRCTRSRSAARPSILRRATGRSSPRSADGWWRPSSATICASRRRSGAPSGGARGFSW
jgi:hypothetical protein